MQTVKDELERIAADENLKHLIQKIETTKAVEQIITAFVVFLFLIMPCLFL